MCIRDRFPSIQKAFDNIIDPKEVAFGKRKIFVDSILSNIEDGAVQLDKEENLSYLFCRSQDEERSSYVTRLLSDKHFQATYCSPANTLILNFNYTQTAKQLYLSLIHI